MACKNKATWFHCFELSKKELNANAPSCKVSFYETDYFRDQYNFLSNTRIKFCRSYTRKIISAQVIFSAVFF